MKADYSHSVMKAMGIMGMIVGFIGLEETGWAFALIILGFLVYSGYDWVQEYNVEKCCFSELNEGGQNEKS